MIRLITICCIVFYSFISYADTVTGSSDAFSGPNIYSPSVTRDYQDNNYKMWYGGWQTSGQVKDHIYYKASGDGINWPSGYIEVLTPEIVQTRYQQTTGNIINITHVNDPTVTKHLNPVSGTYLYTMFFTACIAPCADSANGYPNQIWSVVSGDGINWDYPKPLTPSLPSGVYGPAVPSAIVDNSNPYSVFWHVYFTVSSNNGLNNVFLVYVNGSRDANGSAFSVLNYNRGVGNPHAMIVGSTWYLVFNVGNAYSGYDIYYSTSSTNNWSNVFPLITNNGQPYCATVSPVGLPISNTEYLLYFSDIVKNTNNNGCNFTKNQTISIRKLSR